MTLEEVTTDWQQGGGGSADSLGPYFQMKHNVYRQGRGHAGAWQGRAWPGRAWPGRL